MSETVYLLYLHEGHGGSWPIGIFSTRELAEQYATSREAQRHRVHETEVWSVAAFQIDHPDTRTE